MVKVTHARLHFIPHIPGLGHLDAQLPVPNKTFRSFEMEADVNLNLHVKAIDLTGKQFKFAIPAPSVMQLILDPEIDKKLKAVNS